MVEGGTSGGHTGSSTSSHSSSSSSSSKGRTTRLLIRVSPTVQTERIHAFFDRSLTLAKPPVGAGFVRKVSRKGDDTVVVSIEDALIARRLVSSFSDSRPKIDGHEFTIELYSSDQSKSLSSPSNHNGDKRREKESRRMSGCNSLSSPSTSKRSSVSSRSPSRPSTSTHDSMKNECGPSSSSSCPLPVDPYHGIVGVAMHVLPFRESILKEILRVGLHEIGGYLTHFVDDSGRMKVLLKRSPSQETSPEGELVVQGADTPYTAMSMEETRQMYDQYFSRDKCRESFPSTSSSSSPSVPSSESSSSRRRDALSYESSRTIFLPYLPKGTTKEDLRKRFHKIGTVLEGELKNASSVCPHAIVQFNHTLASVMAMEEYEREQKEGENRDHSNRKRPHFMRSPSSHRVWVANLPPMDEDYVKKKLLELLKGANNPTIVVDLRRREGIIDLGSNEKAKHYLEIIKSTPLSQQGGSVHTWLVADYCSDGLYDHFIERRGLPPSNHENQLVTALSKMHPSKEQRNQAEARIERMKGGEEKMEKKRSINGENGHHVGSPSSTRRLNGEDRRSGDSGFSEDREKNQVLDSDDDEVLERKWRVAAVPDDRKEENGKMRKKLMKLGEDIQSFYHEIPETPKVKKEVKEEEEGEKKENEKMPRQERINNFRDKLLGVSTPLKTRSIEEMMRYRSNPLKSPPIPISPLNGDSEKRPIVSSPPSGSRPVPLHINIPPSTSTTHCNATPSPYARLPPSSSASSSRHPSISTPSTLTPRSQTMPSSNRLPFPPELNGDHPWNGGGPGSNVTTPTSSRLPLSRRESVSSTSSQPTPLPPPLPSSNSIGGVSSALKSPPVSTWNSTANAWKGGPSLSSPVPSSINRVRPSNDAHHKPSTPSQSRPPALPKHSMDKSGFPFGPSTSLPKTPLSLPRSSSMTEKKPNASNELRENIVDNIIQQNKDVLKMKRIPKKENRERDEKEERKEKKRDEKNRERKDDREERKEKKEDKKRSRENETKEEKTRRKELKRKEREKEERKKSMNEREKKRKSMDGEKKKKKKQKRHRSDSDDSDDSDDGNFKPSSSNNKQIMDDEAFARSLAAGSSMYDRVKVRRSGSNKEEKKKIDALEAIRKKKEKKTKKRVQLSSSDSEEEEKEREKKTKREEESSEDEEEKERVKKEKKKEKKRRESSEESESENEREKKKTKKEKTVIKKSSTIDLFEDDDGDSVKSEKKEKLTKKRSHEKEERGEFPSSSTHPPPEKKVKKEESSSSASESEGERSSKKSEVSMSSWREREEKGRRLSESSIATHSEKDEVWKSPASGSKEKEIKEEPKEDRPTPRLMTKAAMKEFNLAASSSPLASNWMNNRETEKAVESIFDDEEEPEVTYPDNNFLILNDANLSSSSSCSSPKIIPSSSLPHRPTPLHPTSILSPNHLLHLPSHHPPASPLISPNLVSPSPSRPASNY
ncbi:hypothetical protein PMAYCL1PPCAC_06694, partial [Pristionchus mayeri]